MKKRKVLITTLVVFCLLVFTVNSVGAVDWQQFKGTTLTLMSWKHPWTDAIKPLLPEFEKKTGMKVNLVEYPEDQHRQRVAILLAGGSRDPDVWMTDIKGGEGERFGPNGWYEPLLQYILCNELTEPEYVKILYDIPQKTWELSMVPGPTGSKDVWGISLFLDPRTYAYRKDLFEKYGLSVPTTFSEMETVAKKIFEETNGEVFGVTLRGKGAAATSYIAIPLYAMGGAWQDEQGNPTINTPEAIKAFDWWGRMLRLYGPPGSVNYHWSEVQSIFAQGRAAQTIQACTLIKLYSDPEQSTVADKVGYAPLPKGPDGKSGSWAGSHQLAISSLSRNKEAAWLLVQYLTSEDTFVHNLNKKGNTSPRVSTWEDPRVTIPLPEDWLYAVKKEVAETIGFVGYAPLSIHDVAQARDVIGEAITASILGEDVKAALDKAQARLEEMLREQKD